MNITEPLVLPVEKIILPFEVGDGLQAMSIESRPHHGGVQYMFKFDNGYGASVIRTPYSYGGRNGLWELAVCKYYEFLDRWHICYNTPITDDVIGYLKDEDVMEYLKQIKELPKGEY